MHSERGSTLLELLITAGFLGLLALAAVATTVDVYNKESMRSAANQIQSMLTRARTESIARNRECRVVIDQAANELTLIDLNDSGTADDIVLERHSLRGNALFAGPGGGPPITLPTLVGTQYHVTFDSAGMLSSSAGSASIEGADRFCRISVSLAGGVLAQRWTGSGWSDGC